MFTLCSTTPHNRDTNKKLVKILHSLLQMDESAPFRKPVPHKALGLGDYKKIVKKPIDLNQIRRQNNDSKYKTIEQALDDIQLCWQNCKLYNHASSEVYQQAINLQKIFWKMVQENFPEVYAATQMKIKQLEANEPIGLKNGYKNESIYEASQSENGVKQQKQGVVQESSLNRNGQGEQEQSVHSRVQEENMESGEQEKSQKSQQKQQQKQPMQVHLRQAVSGEKIGKLSAQMKKIEDKSILEQVLQILFLYQRENLVGSPKGEMHFRMENIHLSTYYRICRLLRMEPDEMLEIIQ